MSERDFLLLASCLLLVFPAASCARAEQPAPRILAVEPDRSEVARYGKLELTVVLEATFDNPYDARQVDLVAVFTGPDGREWTVPGFWDAAEAWRVRFAPSAGGEWRYRLRVRDRHGESKPHDGRFTCRPSDHHGWLQVGAWANPAYSARYLVHHDGTPFYGAGHCDAFDLMSYGWDAEGGFALFDRMAEHGENMLVYWPIYSVEHDPYRHPTTASKAGDAWWPAGYEAMDVAQMHSYKSQNDPSGTGPLIAGWTQRLWQAEAKPNFIGEFGTRDERLHPELLHNGIWAGLAAGGAATPMEWNDSGAWGRMDDEMYEQMAHLATFVADLPLAHLDPAPLAVTTGDEQLPAWGLAGEDGGRGVGLFWVQDTAPGEARADVAVTITGLAPGAYTVRPFDTWQGVYLDARRATADESGRLTIALPPFSRDIAVRLEQE